MDMRSLIETVRMAEDGASLENALQVIADYIQHNDRGDLVAAAKVLHKRGYKEPVAQTRFWRALSHDITEQDRARYSTMGEMFAPIRRQHRMDFKAGGEGFTLSLENALRYVRSVEWLRDHPPHFPDLPLSERQFSIWCIYQVRVNPAQVMFSMRGLRRLLARLPFSKGAKTLNDSMDDLQGGYGSDDEVVIDMARGGIVEAVILYDSRDFTD